MEGFPSSWTASRSNGRRGHRPGDGRWGEVAQRIGKGISGQRIVSGRRSQVGRLGRRSVAGTLGAAALAAGMLSFCPTNKRSVLGLLAARDLFDGRAILFGNLGQRVALADDIAPFSRRCLAPETASWPKESATWRRPAILWGPLPDWLWKWRPWKRRGPWRFCKRNRLWPRCILWLRPSASGGGAVRVAAAVTGGWSGTGGRRDRLRGDGFRRHIRIIVGVQRRQGQLVGGR